MRNGRHTEPDDQLTDQNLAGISMVQSASTVHARMLPARAPLQLGRVVLGQVDSGQSACTE